MIILQQVLIVNKIFYEGTLGIHFFCTFLPSYLEEGRKGTLFFIHTFLYIAHLVEIASAYFNLLRYSLKQRQGSLLENTI